MSEREPEPPGPDGGWGWIVCLAAFYCVSVLDGELVSISDIWDINIHYTAPCPNFRFYLSTGASYTFGVFLDPLEVEMGGGHSKVDFLATIYQYLQMYA